MPLSSHLNVNFTKVQTLLSCPNGIFPVAKVEYVEVSKIFFGYIALYTPYLTHVELTF